MAKSWANQLAVLAKVPAIRIATFGIVCDGAAAAAFAPYMSIFAVDHVGMNPAVYSIVVFVQATMGVLVALAIGYFSDRSRSRKTLLVAVNLAAIFGYIAISRVSSPAALVVVLVIIFPLGASITNQCFAVIRAELMQLPAEERTFPNAVARSCVSLAWIIVPPITALILLNDVPLEFIFVGAAIVTAIYLAFLIFTPMAVEETKVVPRKHSALPFRRVVQPQILVRLLSIGTLEAVIRLHALFFGLMLVNDLGGTIAHVGIAQGILAALEIPFMFAWAIIARRIGLSMTLVAAAGAEIIYMLLLPNAGSVTGVMLVLVFHALGASAILSLSITYVQDLIEDMPGLGSSLISVTSLVATAIAAASFAITTTLWGYSSAAPISAVLALVGGVGIWLCRHSIAEVPSKASA